MTVVITGFRPFGVTKPLGNPSEDIALALADKYGPTVQAKIFDVDETCIAAVQQLKERSDVTGLLMLGAEAQFAPVVMELEGIEKKPGLFSRREAVHESDAARALTDFAKDLGVPASTAPPTPMVWYCLRSCATALSWTEERKVPCIFLHVSKLRSVDESLPIVEEFLIKFMTEVHPT